MIWCDLMWCGVVWYGVVHYHIALDRVRPVFFSRHTHIHTLTLFLSHTHTLPHLPSPGMWISQFLFTYWNKKKKNVFSLVYATTTTTTYSHTALTAFLRAIICVSFLSFALPLDTVDCAHCACVWVCMRLCFLWIHNEIKYKLKCVSFYGSMTVGCASMESSVS